MISFLNIYNSYNEKAYERFIELKVLEATKEITPRQAAEKELYEIQNKIEKENKKFYMECIGFLMALGIVMMLYGFYFWEKKIQPKQDEFQELMMNKTRYEMKNNKRNEIYKKRGYKRYI